MDRFEERAKLLPIKDAAKEAAYSAQAKVKANVTKETSTDYLVASQRWLQIEAKWSNLTDEMEWITKEQPSSARPS